MPPLAHPRDSITADYGDADRSFIASDDDDFGDKSFTSMASATSSIGEKSLSEISQLWEGVKSFLEACRSFPDCTERDNLEDTLQTSLTQLHAMKALKEQTQGQQYICLPFSQVAGRHMNRLGVRDLFHVASRRLDSLIIKKLRGSIYFQGIDSARFVASGDRVTDNLTLLAVGASRQREAGSRMIIDHFLQQTMRDILATDSQLFLIPELVLADKKSSVRIVCKPQEGTGPDLITDLTGTVDYVTAFVPAGEVELLSPDNAPIIEYFQSITSLYPQSLTSLDVSVRSALNTMRVTVVEAKKIHADKKQLQEWLPQAVAESLAVAEQAHRLRRGDRDPIAMCLTTGIEWIFALLVNLEDGSKVLIRSQSLMVTLSPACWKTDSTAATQLKKEVHRVMLYLLAWVSLGCADVLDVLKGSLSKKVSTELFGSK